MINVMERRGGVIFPPCGVKLGETDKTCKIICPAMFWEQAKDDGVMQIESINNEACTSFLEDLSCPEGYDLQSLQEN